LYEVTSQTSLFQDAANGWQRQVFSWVRHCHLAWLGRVFELVVRPHDVHQEPAIGFDLLDELSAFHGNYTHKYTKKVFQLTGSLIRQIEEFERVVI
jgi:hypothetical protein